MLQILRAESVYVDPKGTGTVENGYDMALRLPKKLNISTPVLPDPEFNLYPNSIVYGFRYVEGRLEMSGFVVLAKEHCPGSPNVHSSAFYAGSEYFKMEKGENLSQETTDSRGSKKWVVDFPRMC